ncbi:N-acetylmuramic acid 6-phosphate etherase [Microbacterium sp. M3]|uniref:N-acetylmuramic acid 6-phosphate etherase n=1 Tax=Microbacterium arthrosphaerae TaxID=792652 RepID=A0ABU4H734_9MICO|nr:MULTISPECIES: N-acetylmuramic acid 6-phosphate etherase [Microbacterium]MDW4574469.1 N-acetylmuramic acid 6-phosphate etherase [Microbacterium arthrosphaerae]MDW7608324.1 N-acetylmuramic acid 6-phosphate etherase [Microbacterium sp. M3]
MVDLDDLRHQLAELTTEAVDPDFRDLDLMATDDLVAAMVDHNRQVTDALRAASGALADAVDLAAERMQRGGRLVYIGAGTPGRLGILDASEIPPTFGEPAERVVGIIAGGETAIRSAVENAEDDAGQGRADIARAGIGPDDCVVGLTASGRTPYVLGAIAEARDRGAATVGVSCNPDSALSAAADVGVEVIVGPELVAGSTRLKAGTAQKIVLNTISTLAMVRIGKTYGNHMVDVRATNEKLRARAVRTVMGVADVDPPLARRALADTEWEVKPAILMCMRGLTADAATRALSDADGRLRDALDRTSGAA